MHGKRDLPCPLRSPSAPGHSLRRRWVRRRFPRRRAEERAAVRRPRLDGYDVLRIRNYRLFWLGQWVSLIGTWMQTVTQAWLLTRLSASPLALGILGAASSAPLLVLVLFGGLVSDRLDRRRVIM